MGVSDKSFFYTLLLQNRIKKKMKFALYILIAFVYTFTAAKPQDFSEHLSSEHHSLENELERLEEEEETGGLEEEEETGGLEEEDETGGQEEEEETGELEGFEGNWNGIMKRLCLAKFGMNDGRCNMYDN